MENHLRVVFWFLIKIPSSSDEFALYYKLRYHSKDQIPSDTDTALIKEQEKKYEKDDVITGKFSCFNSL